MTAAEESVKETLPQVPRKRNTGLHGAFWTRILLRLLRILPVWLCQVLNFGVVFVIYLLAGPQRRAVLANLRGLRSDFGPVRRWFGGFQVFNQFALTYLDRLWHMHFKKEVAWDIEGKNYFEEMRSHPGGVLVFTIHSGNYDIGATLFAQRFGRTLHMVRVPEQTEELQELRSAELKRVEKENPHLRVHYNEVDSHLGLELCRILMAGEAVAVQGDRVVTGVSPVEMEHEGVTFKIPRGPLVLGEIVRVPCYPIFLLRQSTLKYKIVCGPCFYDGKSKVRADDLGRDVWLPILHQFVRENWSQWFVFEELVEKKSAPAQDGTEAAG